MKKILFILFSFTFVVAFNNCKKKPETPPITNLSSGTIHTVEQLKGYATCTNSCQRRFSGEDYLIGIVLADEISGNFYKEVYVRDRNGKGGIHLDFLASNSALFVGDSIRMILKGYDVGLNATTGMLEIDSIDYEKAIVKFGTGPKPVPVQLDLSQISGTNPYSNYLCDLVTINGVEFLPGDTNKIWADAVNQSSINHTITDCPGNQIVVRTSNYASFWNLKTPKGNGSITGIATAYGTGATATNQLAIRHPNELNMNGSRCAVYLKKDFNDNSLTSGGWSQQSVTNSTVQWSASTFNSDEFGKISGYVGGANTNSENWLISPSLNLVASNNPVLSFRTAAKFSGNALEVWVSTNYVSGAPGTGVWTQLSGFNLSPNNPGSYVWTNSGNVSLASFKSAATRIAFKYKSTTSGATTYEVDDIVVIEP